MKFLSWCSSNKSKVVKISVFFVLWRLSLFILGSLAHLMLKYMPSFPYANSVLSSYGAPQWFYSWGNFDGVHYLTIIAKGYVGTANIQAFFPLYPLLSSLTSYVLGNDLLAAMLIGNVFALAYFVAWYYFLDQVEGEGEARHGVFLMAVFPTSFFLGATYTESLFLSLVLATFISARQKSWRWAILWTSLATATRFVGIFLVPALALERFVQDNPSWSENLSTIVPKVSTFVKDNAAFIFSLVLAASGLLAYSSYLWYEFGDPFYFFSVQAEFGGTRQESLVFLPQVIWRYLKILSDDSLPLLRYFAYAQEFVLTGVVGLGLLLALKKQRLSYVLFAALAVLAPTLTGTFSSMPRYVLVAFPAFLVLHQYLLRHKIQRLVWYSISIMLLLANTLLFIQGYWVA